MTLLAHLAGRVPLGQLGNPTTQLCNVGLILRLSTLSLEKLSRLLLVQIANACLPSASDLGDNTRTHKLRPKLVELLIQSSDHFLVLQDDRLDRLIELI